MGSRALLYFLKEPNSVFCPNTKQKGALGLTGPQQKHPGPDSCDHLSTSCVRLYCMRSGDSNLLNFTDGLCISGNVYLATSLAAYDLRDDVGRAQLF